MRIPLHRLNVQKHGVNQNFVFCGYIIIFYVYYTLESVYITVGPDIMFYNGLP